MADQPKQESKQEPTKDASHLDWPMALKVLQENEQHALSFKGKEGYNPRIYINKVLAPLKRAYDGGNRTESLFNTIIGLKKSEPKVPESPMRKV